MCRQPRYNQIVLPHPYSFERNVIQDLYKRSVEIKRTASALFNLGVTHYHLSTCPLAIVALLADIM